MPTFYGAINLSKNELQNAVVQNLGTAPSSPVKGQVYFDSTANILYWYNGSQWVAAQGGAGAVPADTTTTLAVGGAAAPGASALYSRGDHAHGMPSFGAATADTAFGTAKSDGVATTIARSDHTHGNPALGTTPSTAAIGDAAAGGVATDAAKTDHKHGMPAFGAISGESTFGAAASNGSAATIARSDHLHGNPTHVAADHATIPISALAAPTADVNWGAFKITNLNSPTGSNDAANKGYVDGLVNGLSWKDAARAATTANIALTGTQTIDGVACIVGDRVLVKNQTTASGNGVYFVASGAWGRTTDTQFGTDIVGMAIYIGEGTTQADTTWTLTTDAPISIGTTSLAFAQTGGPGAITAGAGMTQVGNTLNVIAGDTTLTVAADDVRVNTAVIATVASVTAGDAANVPNTRQVIAGAGLTGGGALSADATLNVVAGDTSLTVAADSVVVNTGVIAPTSRLINTTAPITGGGNLTADRTIAITSFAGSTPGAVPNSPGGTTTFLRADGTWSAPAGGVGKYAAALTGTASPEVVTHNLNTRDVQVQVLNGASPYTAVVVDWDATTVNTITIRYNPNLGAGYRVVVVG